MAITATQEKQHDAHRTPSPVSTLWFKDPPPLGAGGEDKEDKKTPTRIRGEVGDFYLLVEQVNYMTFQPPEAREAYKAKNGKSPPPIFVEQYYVHLLHSVHLTARTFKIYRHQGRYFYSDSVDYAIESASASPPPKDRDSMITTLSRILKVDRVQASRLLSRWTCGN